MFARPCVPYQKGQPKEHAVTGKDKTDRCKLWTDIDLKCKLEEPPPCSFTPESFIKTWMNRHGVEMVPLGMSESDLTVIYAGAQIPDSFAHSLRGLNRQRRPQHGSQWRSEGAGLLIGGRGWTKCTGADGKQRTLSCDFFLLKLKQALTFVRTGDFISWRSDLKATLDVKAGCHRRPGHLHRRQCRCRRHPVAPAAGSPMPPFGSPDQAGMSTPARLRSVRFERLGTTGLTRRLMEASAAAAAMGEASWSC